MTIKKRISFLLVLSLSLTIYAAPKFPFPMNETYQNGIKATNFSFFDVQSTYDVFMKNYYEDSGDLARIKWDEPDKTVSEGIGYGMMIMVYMDNETNNTQDKFDKLWNYYQKWPNGNGFMHWKINGFSGVAEQNGATDGDLDVAFALTMAYAQWGDEKYKSAAKDLIQKIRTHEVNGNNYLKPGDAWDSEKNPSYFVTVALDVFSEVGETNWSTVMSQSYSLLKKCRNGTTGLVPDWCAENGAPSGGERGEYNFDAARTPWRMAHAYAWFGHSDAKDVADKMCSWIKSTTGGNPTEIKSGYKLDGTATGEHNIVTFIGPFICAGMVNSSHQQWVNDGYVKLTSFNGDDNYYNESMQVLTMLLLTGNMPNLYTLDPNKMCKVTREASPSAGGTINLDPDQSEYKRNTKVTITAAPASGYEFSGWSGDVLGTEASKTITVTCDMSIKATFVPEVDHSLVDDCEDGDNVNSMGGKWFTYNDSTDDGASTIVPKTSEDDELEMTDGGYNSDKAVKITFELNQGGNQYDPYVGVGFHLNEDKDEFDISDATGITFYYKGDFGNAKCVVKVETANVGDYGFYEKKLEITGEWTFITLNWEDFTQPNWAEEVPFELTKAIKIGWQANGETGDKGELWLDHIRLPGLDIVGNNNGSSVAHYNNNFSVSVIQPSMKVVIHYTLKEKGDVNVGLYGLKGNLIKNITGNSKEAGKHTETVNLSQTGISQGMYIVRLTTKSGSFSDKVLICK